MSDLEVFEIDDEFDPLADDSLEDMEEEQDPNDEYSVPKIPDADRSVIPEPIILTSAEKIEKLLKGIPGQQFRILACVQACAQEPVELAQIIDEVDASYPLMGSVYSTGRLVQLLEEAGAIDRIEPDDEPQEEEGEAEAAPADEAADEGASDEADADGAAVEDSVDDDAADDESVRPLDYLVVDPGQEYVEVELARPCTFMATQAGLEAVEARTGMEHMQELLDAEPQYIPVYKRVLTMCSAPEGRLVQEINAVIDPDPICKEPRRFSTYFLRKLEMIGAVRFVDTWQTTSYGSKALELGLLADASEAGDIAAAAPAKEKQLAKEAKFEAEKVERERYAAELEAKKAEEAARAAEAGEPLPEPKRPNGSGGPCFAFPYTPPEDEPEAAEEVAAAGEPVAIEVPELEPASETEAQLQPEPATSPDLALQM